MCIRARGVRVLIVEDESIVGDNLAAGLQEHGYTVSAILRSGESAFLRASRISLDNADGARLRPFENLRQFSSQPVSFSEQGGRFQAGRNPLAVYFVEKRGRYELALL